ncbi:hypothetical protein PTKIN_Ptkin16aG0492700 [Pterospermum kingtungense]
MELQHFSHQHPLVFIEETSHEHEKVNCSGCGEMVSGPIFCCVECGFHLHKQCAEAPSEMNHPFHRNHNFNLLVSSPYGGGQFICDFCNKLDERFVYHCSCGLDLHIKCALFSYNIAEKRIAEFQHIARIDPLISTENRPEKLKNAQCFACWKPLLDSVYFSPDCGFYLHVKCVDLPPEINHLLHPQHPLVLQFNSQRLSCHICQKPQRRGLVYSCSSPCEFVLHIECATIPTKINHLCHRKHPLTLQFKDDSDLPCQVCQETKHKQIIYCCSVCKFGLHIECTSPPQIIEDKSHHQHPLILFWRHVSFICDACGTPGNYVSYICSTCCLIVHKKCISLPPIIKFYRHYHPIVHTYFLEEHGFEKWECRLCYEEMNTDHGNYFCSKCDYIVHVNCALAETYFYHVVDSLDTDEAMELSFEKVTDTSIKHFSHDHNLTLSEDIVGDKQCDGCLLSISASCYYCSQCDFFLHKSCAELPMRKHIWPHLHQRLLRLTSGYIFQCLFCSSETSGFAYTCDECNGHHCLQCALLSDIPGCEGHEHPLPFFRKYAGSCNACGVSTTAAYRCKSCNFNLHGKCLRLPLIIARYKYDEHPYKLTYHNKNNDPESNYCDICEEKRNPNHWFYHCEICDNSAHLDCALEKYLFIKLGSICKLGDQHPHPLTFVRKFHYIPKCLKCGKLCLDLALECTTGCSYIVHWECIKPSDPFWVWGIKTIKLLPKDWTRKQLIDGT